MTTTFKISSSGSEANGTSLCGYVSTTYAKLVDLLGQPLEGSSDEKTTAEWVLVFEDGTVATIYDWKLSSTPEYSYDWHVGGKGVGVLKKVEEALNLKTRPWEF